MTRAKALGALVVPVLFAVLQSDGMVARAAKSPKAAKPAAVDGFVEEDVDLPVAVWEKLIPDVGALSAPHLGANVTFSFKTAALTTPEAARYAAMTSSYGFANITFAFKTAALTHAAALTAADAANSLEQGRGAATTAIDVAEIARYLDFKDGSASVVRPAPTEAPKKIREGLVGNVIKVYWSRTDTDDASLVGWHGATVSAYDQLNDVYALEYKDGFVEKGVDLAWAVWEMLDPDVGAMSTTYLGADVTFSFKTAALKTGDMIRLYWSDIDTDDVDLNGWYEATVSSYDQVQDLYALEYTDGFIEKEVDLSLAVWERRVPGVGALSAPYLGTNVTFTFKTAALTMPEAVRYAAMTSSNGFANITFSFKSAALTAAALTAADTANPLGHRRGGVNNLIQNGLLALVGVLVVGAAVALRRRTTRRHEEPGGGGVAEATEKTPLVAL